jgi:hypothetical protein
MERAEEKPSVAVRNRSDTSAFAAVLGGAMATRTATPTADQLLPGVAGGRAETAPYSTFQVPRRPQRRQAQAAVEPCDEHARQHTDAQQWPDAGPA